MEFFFKVCVVIKAGNSKIKLCQNTWESICQIKPLFSDQQVSILLILSFHRCSPCRPVNATFFENASRKKKKGERILKSLIFHGLYMCFFFLKEDQVDAMPYLFFPP